ncbi:hypothetical protein Ait01nite_056750 [Actinoplanes italicus]|uniref:Uncharacterized protein n=1 Tax=Actinoplanes italicus TaxID=113567 RepID=A0A2T0K5I9_9ACTN|nr:hypothetical protein [Actinoplanes italicus]PRX18225.1 hypothetical protein CLV67_11358 [Actinoplanes italicus]GIE32630.1 hypothetical protein Ait01nite_056750 [Actinoplanes italicus]
MRNERFWRTRAENGPPVLSGATPAEALAWTLRERAFVRRFREVFEAALE